MQVWVIQDCAHSFGAEWRGRLVSREGDVALYVLNISKVLSSIFGGMLTFELDSAEAALAVLDNLELCSFAASLGGVRTTTQIPASMAFLDVPEEQRREMNISDGMIRVSTGLEDASDLAADFDAALDRL